MKYAWLLVLALGCDQERQIGLPPGSGEVLIQNLVANVTRSYPCRAGELQPYDSINTECDCNHSGDVCELDSSGNNCGCDSDCYSGRPVIDCADYSMTFTIKNPTEKKIARMTRVKVTIGDLVFDKGGLNCDGSKDWRLDPDATSSVLEVKFMYDNGFGSDKSHRSDFSYPCSYDSPRQSDSSNDGPGKVLGYALPPAITQGSALVEFSGLFEDGEPWRASASAEL